MVFPNRLLILVLLSFLIFCNYPLIAAPIAGSTVPNTGASSTPSASNNPLQVDTASYLDKIKLTNNSGRKLTLKIDESIDNESVRSFQHDLEGSGNNNQWQFTPAGWDEHSFIQSRQRTTTPRTDRQGNHTYQLTISAADGSVPPQSRNLDFYVKEKVLNIGRVRQEGSLWCWAASSQSILNYLGRSVSACELVNMARRGRIWPWENKNVDCCKDGPSGEGCNFGLGAESGIFSLLTGPSTYDVMQEQGFTAKVESGTMVTGSVISNIDDGKPFMIGVQPHFIAARGYRALYAGSSASGSYRLYLHVMDPLVYPHYFLVSHDDISQAGGNYLGLKDPWVVSITNIQSSTPIADQSGWIEVPKSAIANLPFEIRMQGLNKPDYVVEWFSPSVEAVKASEAENGRASAWTVTTPGIMLIGAKVYEDKAKKVLLSEKKLQSVSITPMPNLILVAKGSSKNSITYDLNTPGFGQPLEIFMKLQARFDSKKVPIDVEKVNVLPVWRGLDQEGHEVAVKSADDLLSDKLSNGIYTAEFVPPPGPGKYTITGVLNDVNGKALATSNALTLNYLSPLSAAESEVLIGEENRVKCNISPENLKKFELKWEFSADIRSDNPKNTPDLKILKSDQAGKKFARLIVRALEDKTGKPLDPARTFEIAWEVRAEKKPSVRIDGKKLVLPEEAVLLKAVVEAEPKILSTLRMTWYEGDTLLGEGETLGFSAGNPKTRAITVIVYGKRQEREVELTRASAELVISRPGAKDGSAFTASIENLPGETIAGSAIHPRANSFRQGKLLSVFDEKTDAAALQKKWEDYRRAQMTAQQLDPKGGKAPAIPPRPSGWGVEKFKVIWRSNPSATFSPAETINNAGTSAQLAAPGSFEIWGEILRLDPAGFQPVGETVHQSIKATSSVLNVRMQSPGRPLKPGEVATISAAVTGGKEPYRFEWSGDHAGGGSTVQFVGRKPGSYQLAVQVTDAAGAAGATSVTITIEGIEAKIVGLPDKVIYGTRLPIKLSIAPPAETPAAPVKDFCPYNHQHTNPYQDCDCTCDKCKVKVSKIAVSIAPTGVTPPPPTIASVSSTTPLPASIKTGTKDGSLKAIWQSTPGLTFEPSTSEDLRTTVLFDRMGKMKIWAEIQQKVEGVNSTAGETDVREVEVVAPQFSLQFDPPTGKVGQEIKATIKTVPEISDSLLRYLWDSPVSSNRMEYSESSNKIGFVLKNANQLALHAEAKVPYWGDHIGDAKGNYSATLYNVKATVIGGIGPKPQIWKEGVGLVNVEQGSYAADQHVQVKAELSGDPLPSEVRWQWSVNDGTTLFSAPTSQEVTASRHDTGTAELTVTATDKNKVVLGQASAIFNVTVSDVDLKEAAARAAQVTVSLAAVAAKLKLGEVTTLRATVKGGKPPYNYVWTGDCTGSGAQARFTAKKAGSSQITVTAIDSVGRKGVAVLALDVPIVKLPVTLVADRLELRAAHVAAVQAQVKGGKPPFSYRWSGGVIEGQGAAVKFKAGKEGSQPLQVIVTDDQGNQGSATVTFKVLPLIASLSAHPREVPFGSSLPLSVQVMQSGPTPPSYSSIVFQSSPAIAWAPEKSADGKSTATFNKLGNVRIWAEIWQGEGTGASSSGKTVEEEITVTAPKFELVFDPPRGGVGREIQASVKSTPEMDSSLFKLNWVRKPAASSSGPAGRTISFIPVDYSPQEIIVDVIAAAGGEKFTQVSGQFVPAALAVKARIAGTVGALPKIYRNGKLEAVQDAYAANQRIRLQAEIEGGSEDADQTQFSWSIKGGTIESGKTGQEIVVFRTSPGDCTSTVVAKNKAGKKIGQAEVLVRVTISKDDLDHAQKENSRQDALEKLTRAEQLAVQNKIEEAMALVNEAATVEPQKAAATKKNVASQAAFHGWRSVSELDFPAASGRLELALQLDPRNSESQQRLTQARAWKLDWEKASKLEQEINNLLGAQKLVTAMSLLDQIRNLIQPIPAASKLTPWYNAIVSRCDQARREYDAFLQPLRQNIQKQMNLKAYRSVVSLCQQALQRELFPPNNSEIQSWMEAAQEKLNPSKTATKKPPATPSTSANSTSNQSTPQETPDKPKVSWVDKLGKALDTIGKTADQISKASKTPKTAEPAVTPASSTSSASKPISASPAKVYDNGNTGGCGFTDTATFHLASAQDVTEFSVWYSWRTGETSLPYRILKNEQQIYSGTLHKSDCDTNQTQWCNGKESVKLNMGAGNYKLKLSSSRMCQNAGSGGNGMLKIFSGSPAAPPSTPVATEKSPVATEKTPVATEKIPVTTEKTPVTVPASTPKPTQSTPASQVTTPKTTTPQPQPESCPYNHHHTNPYQDCNCSCEKCRVVVK